MRYVTLVCLMSIINITGWTNTEMNYSDLDDNFRIYTDNVDVNSMVASSLQMQTTHGEYGLKLVPLHHGLVCFTLADIRYRTNVKVPNLFFRVQAVGYINGEEVLPNFNIDKSNPDVAVDKDKLYFKQIHGGIPVWFNEQVDSVKLTYSNSHGISLPQYLFLADLHLLSPQIDVNKNPSSSVGQKGKDIMLALDFSTSVTKRERRKMYRYFKSFTGEMEFTDADSSLAFLNFGTEVYDELEIRGKREFRKTFKASRYPEIDKINNHGTRYTNWSAPLLKALEERPKTLIILTDGWSNYFNGSQEIFTTHFADLVRLSNRVKENGTRIVFVTIGFNQETADQSLLSYLVDGRSSQIFHDEHHDLSKVTRETDIISLRDYTSLKQLNLMALLGGV